MSFILHSKNRTLTVRVKGELDLVTAGEFRETVDKALDEMVAQNLIIDMGRVTFIDSSGLGVILGRYRKVKAKGGQVILIGLNPNIKRILEMSGVQSFIPVCASEADAWRLLDKKAI
ncbi:MAG: anti-sigma F factor antagonist [Peptococcaceae bacterium]|jgi:stage II sporulation protein AA (anti-sigma F factor antagonist)|nr:anti-sigma F factor antagonist [Peptococcaceae bacterium]MDH7525310.1 anti-sigma F factor antagonist [Peptococcaceae bacterium]